MKKGNPTDELLSDPASRTRRSSWLVVLIVALILGLAVGAWAKANKHSDSGKKAESSHTQSKNHKGDKDERNERDDDKDKRDRDHDGKHGYDERHCDDQHHNHPKPPKPPKPPKDHAKVPAAPTLLTAEAISLFQINLVWSDNSTNELGFKIERSLDGTNYAQIAQVLPNTVEYRDLNRFPDTKYFYRARAFNAKGESAYSAVARAQTPAPECELSLVNFGYFTDAPVSGLTNLVAISRTQSGGLAIRRDGSMVGWGQDAVGRPMTAIPSLTNVVAIAASDYHHMALLGNGTVVSWGMNFNGQTDVPQGLRPVSAIQVGVQHSLALLADGTVVGWGENQYGQATPPAGLAGVVAIAAGSEFNLALKSDGTVAQWGRAYVSTFAPPSGLSNVIAIAAGDQHALALKSDGTVVEWRDYNSTSAMPVGLVDVTAIAAGRGMGIALRGDGTLQAWSNEGFFRGLYSDVTNLSEVVAISAGDFSGSALTTTPSDPKRVVAKVIATNEVSVSWINPSVSVTQFQIDRATNDVYYFPGGWTPMWETIGTAMGSATHFSDVAVVTNGHYWYRVRAVNQCGVSQASAAISAYIKPPESSPTLSANQVGNAAILFWYSFYDNGASAIGHRLERAPDDGGEPGAWNEIATVLDADPYSASYTDMGLSLDTTYWYRVRTFNGLGISPYSAPVAVRIVLPPSPTNLRAWVGNLNQIELSWYADQQQDAREYRVERAKDVGGLPGNWSEIASVPSQYYYEVRYTDTGAAANITNWYRVRVLNNLGSSPYSSPISVITAPPTTPILTGEAFGTTAYLRWYQDYAGKISLFQLERSPDVNGQPGAWTQLATITNRTMAAFQNSGAVYPDRDLSPETAYWYRVRGLNWTGASPFSTPVRVVIVPPNPPYIYATMGLSNRVEVTLYSYYPGDQDGYKLERAFDVSGVPGVWTEVATIMSAGNTEGSYSDTNVTALATYWYRARSVNAAGISAYSQETSVSLVPPLAPVLLFFTGAYANEANLFWHASGLSVGGVEGFKIERAIDIGGTPGTWQQIEMKTEWMFRSGFLFSPYSHRDSGLAANTTYWYRIQAYNWAGDSPPSDAVAVRIIPPLPPTNLAARVGDTNQVYVFWYAASPGDQDGFLLEHATDAGGEPGTWQQIATLNVRSNSYAEFIHTNISAGTTQWYRARAFNLLGTSDYSSPARVNLVAPIAPTGLTASSFADRVNLYWSYPDNSYPASGNYEIQRANDVNGLPGAWSGIGTAELYYPTFADTGLVGDTKYWYRIRTVDWIGASPFSEPVSVMIVPPRMPQSIVATIGGTNTVQLQLHAASPYDQDGFFLERAPDAGNAPGVWQQIATVAATNMYSIQAADTNVTANSTNWYRIRAFNRAGISAYNYGTQIRIIPPPAPNLGAQTYANMVRLNWYSYYESYYGKVRGYKLERASDSGGQPSVWEQIAQTTDGYSYGSFNDSNRVANATYWYRLRSYNWIGDGDYSPLIRVTIVPPPSPYIYDARIGNSNQVSFTVNLPFPSDQEGYKIERSSDAGGLPGSWTEIATIPARDVSYTQFTDGNVSANTTNWYRVRSYNMIGHSDYSQPLEIKIVPPVAPANLSAIPFANKVYVSWATGHYFWYGTVDEIQVERAPDVSGVPGAWTRISTLNGSSIEYQDVGFVAGTKNWYRVRARNWVGVSPYTEPVGATITPPAAPSMLFGKIGTTNQINMRLAAAYPNDQDGFIIEHAGDAGGNPGVWGSLFTLNATNTWTVDFANTNAVANSTNWYRARAFNTIGMSSNSIPLTVAIIPPPPPIALNASPFADQVRLNWYADFGQYGDVAGMTIERAMDSNGVPENWETIGSITNVLPYWWPLYSFNDSDLAVNTTYWYRLRSYNWVGLGEPGVAVSATIVPPSPPRYLSATVGTSNKVELRWNPPERNDQQGFIVERADDVAGVPDVWTRLAAINTPANSSQFNYVYYSNTNVLAGAAYWYRVRAFNSAGTSGPSATSRIELVPPPGPYHLSAAPFAGRITLGWSSYYNNDTYGLVNGYRIQRALDSGGSPGVWAEIAAVVGLQNANYVDTDLTANTTYWYRVQAWNWLGGGSYSPLANATIIPPKSPAFVSSNIGKTNQVSLTWQVSFPYDQDGLIIERAADTNGTPGAWEELGIVHATSVSHISFTDTNVTANTTNWYRARTFNTVGNSTNSFPAAVAIIPPSAPLYLSASAYANRADVQWYNYDNNYSEVGGYILERASDVGGIPGTWTPIANQTSSYYSYSYFTDTNLSESTYWYRVRAYSWVGVGVNSRHVSVTIRKPAAPNSITTRIAPTNEVYLRWSIGYPSDADVFFIERATDVGGYPSSWTQIATQTNDNNYYITISDTNVTAFTTNWYRIRAWNAVGYSDYSTPTISRIIPPPAVNSFQMDRLANQVTFRVENYLEPYGYLTGYKIERATDSNGVPGSWSQIAAVPIVNYSSSYTDSNLVAGATYWYRLRAWSWVGEGEYTSPVSITILPPASPVHFYASANYQNQIYLWWSMGYPTDQDGFKLERSTDAQITWTQIAMISATNWYYGNYTDTNFVANVTNYYRVRSFNIVGNSSYSATASAIIQLPSASLNEGLVALSPPRINQLTLTNHDVLLTWTATGGKTNVVEATSQPTGGFAPVSPNIVLTGSGSVTTNYLDVGALTNSTSRFYRIRVVP